MGARSKNIAFWQQQIKKATSSGIRKKNIPSHLNQFNGPLHQIRYDVKNHTISRVKLRERNGTMKSG